MPEGVIGAARSRAEKGADRLMRLDLVDEHNAVGLGQREVGRFPATHHQILNDAPPAIDELAAAQKGRPHAEGFNADIPELACRIEFDHGVLLHRGQHAIGRGGRKICSAGHLRQREAIAFGDELQEQYRPVQRLHRADILRSERASRPAARALFHRFDHVWFLFLIMQHRNQRAESIAAMKIFFTRGRAKAFCKKVILETPVT